MRPRLSTVLGPARGDYFFPLPGGEPVDPPAWVGVARGAFEAFECGFGECVLDGVGSALGGGAEVVPAPGVVELPALGPEPPEGLEPGTPGWSTGCPFTATGLEVSVGCGLGGCWVWRSAG